MLAHTLLRAEATKAMPTEATIEQRTLDRGGDQRAGLRMGGVALDHDRATGGQRRGGVTTGGREGEREVRRAEHRDRAERHHAQAQVGARQRLAGRQRSLRQR